MKVKVLKLGYAAKEVEAPEGSNVEDALRLSEMEQEDGYSVTLNGVGANLTARLNNGDVVALTPKVEGG